MNVFSMNFAVFDKKVHKNSHFPNFTLAPFHEIV